MEIKQELPPNYNVIATVFPYTDGLLYCYGDTIYNASGREIPEDIIIHESIHAKRQGDSPDVWWEKYISDSEFRYTEEVEAYAHQYVLVKKVYPEKLAKQALFEFSNNLRSLYTVERSYAEAESDIRRRAKEIISNANEHGKSN